MSFGTRRLHPIALAIGLLAVLLAACATGARAYTLPPANAQFDYQIGGAYTPLPSVGIVDRDRLAAPVRGRYNVCYVNAFQTQPGDAGWWTGNAARAALLLRKNGRYVIDPDWPDEYILDTSTPAKRTSLLAIVGGWIDRCAGDGFQAVEPDNLDSWTRSRRLLTQASNEAFATLLATRAHAADLAIAQKNTTDVLPNARAIGFDFAIAEECQVYGECGDYTAVYRSQLYEIEYNDNTEDADGDTVAPISFFRSACAARGARASVIYRDRDVVARGASGYTYQWC